MPCLFDVSWQVDKAFKVCYVSCETTKHDSSGQNRSHGMLIKTADIQ